MTSEYSNFANPIGTRLKQEMKKRGFTSTELARRADVLTSFLYDIISGKSSNPSTVKLARVADALGISLSYLVSGVSTSEDPTLQNSSKNSYVTVPRIVVENPANIPSNNNGLISYEDANETHCFSSEWIERQLGAHIPNLRLLTIDGDSMEPSLFHGDTVLIDISKRIPSPPGIFIIFDGLGLFAKRLEYLTASTEGHTSRIRIASNNPHYATYERSVEDTLIVGRVVWFSRAI